MARKTITITLEKGRDEGKRFVITEMSAMKAEKWAARALFGIMGSEKLDLKKIGGMEKVAEIGVAILSKIPIEVAEPLMDELMKCIEILPNPSDPMVRRPVEEDDIEEIASLFKLKAEVLKLHIDFFTAAAA
jgi:hypothetical protein